MNLRYLILSLFIIIGISFNACDDSNHHDEELITTVHYILKDTLNRDSTIFIFKDLDGEGGDSPEIKITGTLKSNRVYEGVLELFNESENKKINVSDEVREEGVAHQVFYIFSSGLQIQNQYLDKDSNGKPIGLNTRFITKEPSKGTLRIILRHEPDKYATGVEEGNPVNAGGETDIDIVFEDVEVK